MTMAELAKSVGIPLVITAIMSVANVIYTADTQRVLLTQNVEATKELSKAVTELRIEVATDRGKYVTREELRAELERGHRNGS